MKNAFKLLTLVLVFTLSNSIAQISTREPWISAGIGYHSNQLKNVYVGSTGRVDSDLNPITEKTESSATQWILSLKGGSYSNDGFTEIVTEFPGWFLFNAFMENGVVEEGDPDVEETMYYNNMQLFEWVLGVPVVDDVPGYLGGQVGYGTTGAFYENAKKGDFFYADGWLNYGLNASYGLDLGDQLLWTSVLYDWYYPSGNQLRAKIEFFPFAANDPMGYTHIQLLFKMQEIEGRKGHHYQFEDTTFGVMVFLSGLY